MISIPGHIIFICVCLLFSYCVSPISSSQGGSQPGLANHWSTGSPMPTPRDVISACTLNEKIYVIGGVEKNGNKTDIVEVFHPETNSWTSAGSYS